MPFNADQTRCDKTTGSTSSLLFKHFSNLTRLLLQALLNGRGSSLLFRAEPHLQDLDELLVVLHNQNVGLTVLRHVLAGVRGVGGVNTGRQTAADEKINQILALEPEQ